LTNICLAGNVDQITELVDREFVELLVDTIRENTETRLLQNCLDALDAVLQACKTQDEMIEEHSCEKTLQRLAACGGYVLLEDLQNHKDDGIYKIVAQIIENFLEFS